MKGYFYIHNNTPVIATEERPDETSFYYQANGAYLVHAEYYEAMEEWESQLIDVKNKTHRQHDDVTGEPTGWGLMDFPDFGIFTGITPGTRVEHNNGVIHKIL